MGAYTNNEGKRAMLGYEIGASVRALGDVVIGYAMFVYIVEAVCRSFGCYEWPILYLLKEFPIASLTAIGIGAVVGSVVGAVVGVMVKIVPGVLSRQE